MLTSRGFTVADMDKFSFGQLINYIYEYDRMQARARGEDVPDLEAQYRQLKAAEPVVKEKYESGEISRERYETYLAAIAEWEN